VPFRPILTLGVALTAFLWGSLAESEPVRGAGRGEACAPRSGAVSWWPADGSADDHADGNHGALRAGAAFRSGKIRAAFSLDGVGAHIAIGNPENLKLTGSLTLAAWVKLDRDLEEAEGGEPQNAAVITKWAQNASLDSYGLWLAKREGVLGLVGGIGVEGNVEHGLFGGVVPVNLWTHVAMSCDATNGEQMLYVNGEAVASRLRPGGTDTSDSAVLIGREDTDVPRPFPGAIDEAQIYAMALSETDVRALYDTCNPTVTLSKTHGPPGTRLKVLGSEFEPGEKARIFFDSTKIRAKNADPSGVFKARVQIPVSASPGTHVIRAVGARSGLSDEAVFQVESTTQSRDAADESS
jgi:hypothetical protein